MARITWSCCQSFSPKRAACGEVRWKSFATTVATPRKWPGRFAPHNPPEGRSVAIGQPGELHVRRHPGVFDEYYKNPDATRQTAGRGALGEVALQVPRVARQVLLRPELGGVHEDARHREAVRPREPPGLPQEREVPVVQVAHGRHEDDARPGLAGGGHAALPGARIAVELRHAHQTGAPTTCASSGRSASWVGTRTLPPM